MMEEHKHKLLATASRQPLDRLSTLPEELGHHILSFLTFRDLAQVGCVSKRCRELYLSTPSLNFDGIPFMPYEPWKQLEMLSCFDRFLIQRGDNKIQRFRVVWDSVCETTNRSIVQKFRLVSWIHYAVRCNVEELDLDLYAGPEEFNTYDKGTETLTLPSCIFLCQSLRSLRVALRRRKVAPSFAGSRRKVAPSFACSSNLRCLELVQVTIDEWFCKSISCSCKCLRELRLQSVHWKTNISIESSSLESFHFVSSVGRYSNPRVIDPCHLNISGEKLEDLHVEYWGYNYTSTVTDLLHIVFAPNLKYFEWSGGIISAPSFACSTNLQYLKLRNVTMDEGFCKSFSCSGKSLKQVWLHHIFGITDFSIESSSLESFRYVYPINGCGRQLVNDRHLTISGEKLEDLHIESHTSRGRDLLNIFAPNLKYLKWIGDIMINLRDFGNLICLEKAEILVYPRKHYFDKVFEVLCSMPRVKFLTLNGMTSTVKALFGEGSLPTPPLDNIWYFCMGISRLEDDLVPPMVHLLRGMPNLNSLHVKTRKDLGFNPPPNVSGFDRRYWKSQNLAFIHRLEEVTIEISNAAVRNELELVLYLLEHAENLKKMVIFYSPRQSTVLIFTVLSAKSSMDKVVFRER